MQPQHGCVLQTLKSLLTKNCKVFSRENTYSWKTFPQKKIKEKIEFNSIEALISREYK